VAWPEDKRKLENTKRKHATELAAHRL